MRIDFSFQSGTRASRASSLAELELSEGEATHRGAERVVRERSERTLELSRAFGLGSRCAAHSVLIQLQIIELQLRARDVLW
jgi:hypothetical protein